MAEFEFVGGWKEDFRTEKELTHWETFRNHREIIGSFIQRHSAPFASSLCVLGAGFCNDLDLNQLTRAFEKVALVDIRPQDVQVGLHQQGVVDNKSIEVLPATDVTGVHEILNQYKEAPADSLLDSVFDMARKDIESLSTQYDSVASTCLLSQLLNHATECIGDGNPRFVELLQLIRQRHIQLMLRLLKPGGTGFLFSDFVSSVSLPELFTTTDLKETVSQAIKERNFLHGLNPGMIVASFEQEDIKRVLKSVKVTDPWRWVLPERIYACTAVIFEKNS